ncbi:MarR family winged helix-turn-helix transcriptional regulator [Micromonospora sp. MS34]|uniref:MarR family winged helix-turn-helix transcriptional regulator n=1 Tax=Micromonospora sp. MS34 TaxID=3385971 RepID=UPI00399FB58C
MSSVNHDLVHVFDLLGAALTVGKRAMEAEVADEPHHLRGSHLRLLSLTPVEGMRPTDLAGRVGMTKQSLGEFVATMQKTGFLHVDPDPTDRRARIVRPTVKGLRLQARIMEIFAETEDRWRSEIGDRDWATFRRVLAHIADRNGRDRPHANSAEG